MACGQELNDLEIKMSNILANYQHERHFLQIVHVSRNGSSKRPFVYMKNHKAACSTVLATLLHQQMVYMNLPLEPISADIIHKPPKHMMQNGKRSLNTEAAIKALTDTEHYKFTVVREPVSRLLSAFSDKVLGQTKQRERFLKQIDKPLDWDIKLEDFIDIVCDDSAARNLDRHWRSQCKEISYSQVKYDYIGTVENINVALQAIMRELFGTSDFHMEDTRKTIGHKTKSAPLRDRLAPKYLAKLEQAYSDDFQMYHSVTQEIG